MRTSPPHVRRPRVPRALSAALVGLVVLVGASCGDDGAEQSTPSTTAPPTTAGSTAAPSDTGGPTTTAGGGGGGGASTASTTAPGDPVELLTPAQAEAELARILERYRVELQGAKQRNALDEQFQAGLASVLLPALRDNELDVLRRIGAPGSLADSIAPASLGTVEVDGGDGSCTSGTARIDFTPFYGAAAAGPKTYFFKMTTGEGGDEAWRLAAVGFTESGEPFPAAQCEESSP